MFWQVAKSVLPWAGTAIALAYLWLLRGKLKLTQDQVRLLEALSRSLRTVSVERQKHIEALNKRLAERHDKERRDDQDAATALSPADFLRHSGR